MRCPNCSQKILYKSKDVTIGRFKGALVFADGSCKTKCFHCKAEIIVPVTVDDDAVARRTPTEVFYARVK